MSPIACATTPPNTAPRTTCLLTSSPTACAGPPPTHRVPTLLRGAYVDWCRDQRRAAGRHQEWGAALRARGCQSGPTHDRRSSPHLARHRHRAAQRRQGRPVTWTRRDQTGPEGPVASARVSGQQRRGESVAWTRRPDATRGFRNSASRRCTRLVSGTGGPVWTAPETLGSRLVRRPGRDPDETARRPPNRHPVPDRTRGFGKPRLVVRGMAKFSEIAGRSVPDGRRGARQ